MPDAIITSTESTFGTISGTFAADQSTVTGTVSGIITGTLSGSVGVPGPQGQQGVQGPVGPPGPAGPGSTWGGIAGTLSNQTDLWSELGSKYPASNPSGFITASALSPYLTAATANATFQTLAGMSSYLTTSAAAAGYYPLTGNPSGFLTAASLSGYATESWVTGQDYITSAALTPYLTSATAAATYQTLSGMSAYLTTATAASTYYLQTNPSGFQTAAQVSTALSPYLLSSTAASTFAPIAAGLPTGGTVGQVLTKNSGTNWDDSWQTLIPGDRYLTSSTTSLTINNANKTLTVGTGLSYSSQQDIVITHDATNHMHARVLTYNSGTGVMDVDVLSHSGAGTYATWTVNVGGTPALASVVWGDITGTLGAQSDLATALGNKLETSDAASTYYPLTNPAGYIDSSALVGYATESWVMTQAYIGEAPADSSLYARKDNAWQSFIVPTTYITNVYSPLSVDGSGNLSIDLTGYATESWVTSQGYLTSAPVTSVAGRTGAITLAVGDVSGAAALAGATFTGLISTLAPTTATAGLRLPHGTAPTTPVNGDLWTTTSGLFARINGASRQYVDLDGTQTLNGPKTFSNANQTLGNSTAAGTIAIGTGATVSGSTKAVNIGTGGVAGSTTNIAIGSTTGTSTTTLQGTTNGVTAAADTNSVALATTAYVVGQAGSATPLVNGTAAAGTSLRYARQDHVHPTDTTRAATASPTFTGTPLSTTAAADTNTTQIATTAFVVAQAGSATPLVDGTAAVGTSLRYARQDHVHPTDTTRAALSGATFTGEVVTPASTTGTAGLMITPGVAPSAPVNGEIWATTTDLQVRLNGVTKTIAEQSWVTAQGYITSSALTPYLTSATAASTYQTISGMSSYLTTSAAAAAYYPLTGNPSGFLTSAPVTSVAGRTGVITLAVADVSGAAPLASPSLSGTPLSTTAAVDTNTTQIATTAFVVAQAAAATPLVNGTAAVGTSLRYARADHVHGTDTTRAALNSPAFTGSPSLPTGTTAVTQTAGNNTTALATTAFVRADNNVKAWVNFNGTGTVAIRASFNVTSITDNGVGDYTVNFTTAMADANYAVSGLANRSAAWSGGEGCLSLDNAQGPTASNFRIRYTGTFNTATPYDVSQIQLSILR